MKRGISLILALILTVCLCSGISMAVPPEAFAVVDPTPQQVAGVVDAAMDGMCESGQLRAEMHFAYSPEDYSDLLDFKTQLGERLHPLMTALFCADMVGRDYITVRSSYGMLRREGKVAQYYYSVTLQRYPDTALRTEMDRLVAQVEGLTPTEQVEWLANYLFENVTYDEETTDSSGTFLALMEGRGVCMGYTRSLMELCRLLKIPCVAVVNDTHMWNAVYLEGRWQMLDVTWNIGLCDTIQAVGHEYDAGLYRKAVYYHQNRYLNRGKAMALSFEDIGEDWYRTPVEYALGRGLFRGTDAHLFSPDGKMTRGMFVTVLGRLCGAKTVSKHSFTDVPAHAYYRGYVGWAAKAGIVRGIGDNCFAPERPITRGELCKMMVSFAKVYHISLPSADTDRFTDHGEIPRWARKSVYICKAAGLIRGKGNRRFDPEANATRAEVATVLYHFCKNYL